MEILLFSHEAGFHLEEGINVKNSVHLTENPYWLLEMSLNSSKVMDSGLDSDRSRWDCWLSFLSRECGFKVVPEDD